jgi:hypothetical protein
MYESYLVLIPTHSSAPAAGFAYDTTRDLVWMFGGDPTDNTDLLYSFDPTTLEWDEIDVNGSDEPETRFSMVAGWSEELDSLVIGTGEGASKSLFYADMWAYQPQSNKWTRRSDGEAMPETRYGERVLCSLMCVRVCVCVCVCVSVVCHNNYHTHTHTHTQAPPAASTL